MRPDPPNARACALRRDEGFTIVEVLVATVLLVGGILALLTLLTGALRATAANNERVAATNLARELVEETRALDYDDMAGGLVRTRLQERGIGAGSPWRVRRGGVTYTVSAMSCTYDEPADRLAAVAPQGVCTPQPSGVTGDLTGDDFRRTTFRIAWPEAGGGERAVTQTTLVVNPSGGLGPRILSITPLTQTITTNAAAATVVWTTTPARSLRWSVDDGASAGSLSGSSSFTTAWNIGSSGSGSEVLDGSYEITAQPFDDRGIAGEAKRANVVLNRRQPYPPAQFAGGHDTRLATLLTDLSLVGGWVDLQWAPSRERDVLGYRVLRAGLDGIVGNGDDTQVCPAAARTMLARTTTSCADRSPLSTATAYYIVAVDRAPDGTLREGDRQVLAVGLPTVRPRAPVGPVTLRSVREGLELTWSPSASGDVRFYRIYRDGTDVGYGDRYDRTIGTAPSFVDADVGNTGHRYWITAVDGTFNESDPLGPVSWSP